MKKTGLMSTLTAAVAIAASSVTAGDTATVATPYWVKLISNPKAADAYSTSFIVQDIKNTRACRTLGAAFSSALGMDITVYCGKKMEENPAQSTVNKSFCTNGACTSADTSFVGPTLSGDSTKYKSIIATP